MVRVSTPQNFTAAHKMVFSAREADILAQDADLKLDKASDSLQHRDLASHRGNQLEKPFSGLILPRPRSGLIATRKVKLLKALTPIDADPGPRMAYETLIEDQHNYPCLT